MLFDDEYLYKEYFNMTDAQVEDMKERVKKQNEEQANGGAPGAGGAPSRRVPKERLPLKVKKLLEKVRLTRRHHCLSKKIIFFQKCRTSPT